MLSDVKHKEHNAKSIKFFLCTAIISNMSNEICIESDDSSSLNIFVLNVQYPFKISKGKNKNNVLKSIYPGSNS